MASRTGDSETPVGRWIRPRMEQPEQVGEAQPSSAAIEESLVRRVRERIGELASLERRLESKILERWAAAEAKIGLARESARAEVESLERVLRARVREAESQAREIAKADGFREGFATGREEGLAAGTSEGRAAGLAEGRDSGRRQAAAELHEELARAVRLLRRAAERYETQRREFRAEAKREVVRLGVAIGRALVKREVRDVGDPAIRNIERAVDLMFRRGEVLIELHADDVRLVEEALSAHPRWSEEFDAVELRAVGDLARGGCRLLAGDGIVDLDLEVQIGIIEEAILGAVASSDCGAPSDCGHDGDARSRGDAT